MITKAEVIALRRLRDIPYRRRTPEQSRQLIELHQKLLRAHELARERVKEAAG